MIGSYSALRVAISGKKIRGGYLLYEVGRELKMFHIGAWAYFRGLVFLKLKISSLTYSTGFWAATNCIIINYKITCTH